MVSPNMCEKSCQKFVAISVTLRYAQFAELLPNMCDNHQARIAAHSAFGMGASRNSVMIGRSSWVRVIIP
jgi:hypothetical protein